MLLPFRHLTSADQLSVETIAHLFAVTRKMEAVIASTGRSTLLQNHLIALLFYEPSSRTMLSFQAAAQRLGAGILLAQGKDMSSLKKGESLEDTIRVVSGYSDLIVMRHDEAGSADRAAAVAAVPFVNAGDGGNQHPTQSLLDLYTIEQMTGRLDRLHIAFACDPRHSRTIRSLATVLSAYPGIRFTFISPPTLRINDDLRAALQTRGVPYTETDDLRAGTQADVLYLNRLQEERFADRSEFERYRSQFRLTAALLKNSTVVVLNPLPRIDEMDTSVDDTPNAAYFQQAKNGVPVRMALLAMMLGKA